MAGIPLAGEGQELSPFEVWPSYYQYRYEPEQDYPLPPGSSPHTISSINTIISGEQADDPYYDMDTNGDYCSSTEGDISACPIRDEGDQGFQLEDLTKKENENEPAAVGAQAQKDIEKQAPEGQDPESLQPKKAKRTFKEIYHDFKDKITDFLKEAYAPLPPPTPDSIEILFQHRPGDFASLVAAEEASQNPAANRMSPNAEARVIAKLIKPLVLLAGDDVSRVYGISGPNGRPQILKVG